MPGVSCTSCGSVYPKTGSPYVCPDCGGTYDYEGPFQYQKPNEKYYGLWRYITSFGIDTIDEPISLGEGDTPLIWDQFEKYPIGLKCEHLNPTGSYKDRGTTVLINFLKSRGVKNVVEDSSGNAGASLAAYAARAGISSEIYIPDSASGVKRIQIEKYGSHVVPIPGSRMEATHAALMEVNKGKTYASHAYMPFGLAGIATIAFEIAKNKNELPGTIIAPVGQGGLLLGLIRGFESLLIAKTLHKLPYFVGVQANNCSPILSAFIKGQGVEVAYKGTSSLAEGVCVSRPIRGDALLKSLQMHPGEIIGFNESDIVTDYHEIAARGYFVEPTSALVWCALKRVVHRTPGPHILILSGSGLKYNERK
jgi:threonine synthase